MYFTIVIFVVVGAFLGCCYWMLYWLGILDRPKFRVVESILLGDDSLMVRDCSNNNRLQSRRKRSQQQSYYYAIVTSVANDDDLDYDIDKNICTVLKATKKAIEMAVVISSSTTGSTSAADASGAITRKDDDSDIDNDKEPHQTPQEHQQQGRLSIATSYLISGGSSYDCDDEKYHDSDPDDNIGITIFLQDSNTGECYQTAVGFLVETHDNNNDFQYVQEIARKATKIISRQGDLLGQQRVRSSLPSSSAETTTSNEKKDDDNDNDHFFKVHAVALGGGGPVLSGRIPIRSRFGFYVARLLHWGRAHTKYMELMSTSSSPSKQEEKQQQLPSSSYEEEERSGKAPSAETAAAAVACEIYVNGQNNPFIGSIFVDYLYLLDRNDREMVWKHLDTPLPSA